MNEGQDANTTDPSHVRSTETPEMIGQRNAPRTQEEWVDRKEPARNSLFRHLKTAIPHLLSSSSKSKGKAKEQTQLQSANKKRDAAAERKVSHENGAEHAAAKNNSFFWPQHLPETCARARVMTFGYDSDVSKFFGGAANQNTFYDHAGDLLGALVRKRTNAVCVMTPQYVLRY